MAITGPIDDTPLNNSPYPDPNTGGTPTGGTRWRPYMGPRPKPVIPNTQFPSDQTGQLSPNSLNRLATPPERTQTISSSLDEIIPILYGGPERMAGKLYCAKVTSYGFLYMALIFCEGEVESVGYGTSDGHGDESGFEINDKPMGNFNIDVHAYRGTQTQNVDSWLSTHISGFNENLRGTAYAVIQAMTANQEGLGGVPRLTALIKGRKVYDPRSNLLAGSNQYVTSLGWTFYGSMNGSRDQNGPFGAQNYATKFDDISAATYGYLSQAVTVPNDGSKYFVHVKVKYDLGRPTALIDLQLGGGTARSARLRIKPADGSYDTTGSNAISDVSVSSVGTGGSYWQVTFAITNNSSGNTSLGLAIYPAVAPTGSFTDSVSATGYNTFCEVQIRRSDRPVGYVESLWNAVDQPTQWSDNPALCLGDYLANSTYGEGRTVDANSLAEAAAYCDEALAGYVSASGSYTWNTDIILVTASNHNIPSGMQQIQADFTGGSAVDGIYTGWRYDDNTVVLQAPGSGSSGSVIITALTTYEKRSRMTLLIDRIQPAKVWRDVLRAYVPCWVNLDGDKAYLRVDKAGSVDHTFTTANIVGSDPITLKRSGIHDTPNVVSVGWTSIAKTPWSTQTAMAEPSPSPSVKRKTRIDMPGIRSYSQARRFAIERLNHYTVEDLSGDMTVFEEGLKVWPGDIISVTDSSVGLSSKQFRVLGVSDLGHGLWKLRFREYQSNAYSDVVESAPASPDTQLPTPWIIPAVTNLTALEEWRDVAGTQLLNIQVSWTPEIAWPYAAGVEVEIFDEQYSGTYTWSGNTITVTHATGVPVLSIGEEMWLDFTSGDLLNYDDRYQISTVTGNPTTQFTLGRFGSGTGGNVNFRKLREKALISLPTSGWVSAPIDIGISYLIKARIFSVFAQRGARSSTTFYVPKSAAYLQGATRVTIYTSEDPPEYPSSGTLWFNSKYCRLYIYFFDSNNGQWIAII